MNIDEEPDRWLTEAWTQHHTHLVNLAFRMLGDIGEAEDVVQEAFSRLLRADRHVIEDERGWLIVVTSRLCLDVMRSARARREQPREASGLDVVDDRRTAAADPADRVTLDDSVRLALLVVLERLSPAERVVFVLHDIFSMPFPVVAQTVGRTAPACRQLARRARQKIAEGEPGTRAGVASAEHRLVTEKFIAACANGDLDGLLAVLAPDAWGDIDLGPDGPAREVVHGAAQIAANLLRFWGPATLVSQPLAGQPALLGFRDRDLAGVLVLGMRGELIESVHVIADPRKLAALGLQLSGPA